MRVVRACLAVAGMALMFGAVSAQAAAPPVSGFAAKFIETRTLPGFDTPLVSHGIMRFDREQGFHWEITKPYRYVFEMDAGRAKEVLPDGTVRQLDPDETPWLEAVEHIFVSALAGDRSDLARYFNVDIQPLPEGEGRHVTLTPKPGAMAKVIDRIEVTETAPGQPRRLQIDEAGGGHMDIRFTPIHSATGQ
ncbi:MAG TPA: outer membrane lipoprotein carrier protein LolA [Gammaproteobacteria bacterium]|nr:outer membrane lipoprotein carrier protein LolA [Gammaproteobacteria bacterium]HET7587325.1 outer membrane lipoprotein carrier protein LolA [Gammaproteobacteria bacterium]